MPLRLQRRQPWSGWVRSLPVTVGLGALILAKPTRASPPESAPTTRAPATCRVVLIVGHLGGRDPAQRPERLRARVADELRRRGVTVIDEAWRDPPPQTSPVDQLEALTAAHRSGLGVAIHGDLGGDDALVVVVFDPSHGHTRRRRLTASAGDLLSSTVVLAAAELVDASRGSSAPGPGSEPAAEPSAELSAELPAEPPTGLPTELPAELPTEPPTELPANAASSSARAPSPPRWGAGVGVGVLWPTRDPRPTAALNLAAGVSVGAQRRIELGLDATVAIRSIRSTEPEGVVRSYPAMLSARASVELRPRGPLRLAPALYLGAAAVRIDAAATDPFEGASTTRWAPSGGVGFALGYTRGRFTVDLGPRVWAPLGLGRITVLGRPSQDLRAPWLEVPARLTIRW